MFEYISGKFIERTPTHFVVDVNGIGYHIQVSLHTYAQLKNIDAGKLYVYFAVKEDSHTLYGFADDAEKKLFKHLISVNGVGTGTARMILSSLSPPEVHKCIVSGNAPVLQSIKGIGAKSAQRIIIDLKDKLLKEHDPSDFVSTNGNMVRDEALSALLTLGFARSQAEKALDHALRNETDQMDVEQVLKAALSQL
ncbi:MAG TPA: Holliday junction branch migration protein RuvA [Bacteroidia bacterium]|nr:Holliday junction branch migration protein RuvA [Bacteroidia bacterium]HNT79092.1 Holliday junction branch migration protein RuvA [Bacteroidia bacterium]